MTELLRPWKLTTLVIGLLLLIVGGDYYNAPDWDTGISIIMGVLTYLTAPYVIRNIINRTRLILSATLAWFSIDGCYWLYWSLMNPEALVMRDANAACSTFLYFMMGMIWFYQGSLGSLAVGILNAFRNAQKTTL